MEGEEKRGDVGDGAGPADAGTVLDLLSNVDSTDHYSRIRRPDGKLDAVRLACSHQITADLALPEIHDTNDPTHILEAMVVVVDRLKDKPIPLFVAINTATKEMKVFNWEADIASHICSSNNGYHHMRFRRVVKSKKTGWKDDVKWTDAEFFYRRPLSIKKENAGDWSKWEDHLRIAPQWEVTHPDVAEFVANHLAILEKEDEATIPFVREWKMKFNARYLRRSEPFPVLHMFCSLYPCHAKDGETGYNQCSANHMICGWCMIDLACSLYELYKEKPEWFPVAFIICPKDRCFGTITIEERQKAVFEAAFDGLAFSNLISS
jgi:hypothetical protein